MNKTVLWILALPLEGGMPCANLHQPRAGSCVTFDSS